MLEWAYWTSCKRKIRDDEQGQDSWTECLPMGRKEISILQERHGEDWSKVVQEEL